MTLLIKIIIVITGILAIYWVFYGQRKYNEMFMPKKKIKLKAVIFDLDGVIIDSFDLWFRVFNKLREKHKLKAYTIAQFKKNVWGGSVDNDAKNHFNNIDVNDLKKEYLKLIIKNISESKLLSNAIEVLNKIKKKGLKVGLITNNFTSFVEKVLEHHKIKNKFDAIITADDVEKPKPNAEGIFKLCKKLNLRPDETILVGDSVYDVQAGQAAGCFVIGLEVHGDLIISELKDLYQLV